MKPTAPKDSLATSVGYVSESAAYCKSALSIPNQAGRPRRIRSHSPLAPPLEKEISIDG
jgi:hypothetical protein